jgi:hypothetical protein
MVPFRIVTSINLGAFGPFSIGPADPRYAFALDAPVWDILAKSSVFGLDFVRSRPHERIKVRARQFTSLLGGRCAASR